jgi:site-specific DNA-cytosine methylase
LEEWRNNYTIDTAKAEARAVNNSEWTVGILCSGGCLDTIAAMRSGFKPIWSSEVDPAMARMFKDLTGADCLGDTFGHAMSTATAPRYLKSGQPCSNFSRSGDRLGADGDSGWMFVEQTTVILKLQPWAFTLEISDHATEVNNGREVNEVINRLNRKYVLYTRLIQVWRYGDPSNRKRLFMVGILKELGQAAYEFVWP